MTGIRLAEGPPCRIPDTDPNLKQPWKQDQVAVSTCAGSVNTMTLRVPPGAYVSASQGSSGSGVPGIQEEVFMELWSSGIFG